MNKSGLIKIDILGITSLAELEEFAQKASAEARLKEENQLFNDFIETGKVKPYPKKTSIKPDLECKTTRIGHQTVRNISTNRTRPNPNRKTLK